MRGLVPARAHLGESGVGLVELRELALLDLLDLAADLADDPVTTLHRGHGLDVAVDLGDQGASAVGPVSLNRGRLNPGVGDLRVGFVGGKPLRNGAAVDRIAAEVVDLHVVAAELDEALRPIHLGDLVVGLLDDLGELQPRHWLVGLGLGVVELDEVGDVREGHVLSLGLLTARLRHGTGTSEDEVSSKYSD